MLQNRMKTMLGTTAFAIAGGVLLASSAAYAGGGDRFECRADAALEDASMDARFESKGSREKFSASFEAAPGGSYQDGDVLQVSVAKELVGTITLVAPPNGDPGGDLNFDTTAGRGDADSPFPDNWPKTGAGTTVYVGTLGCTFQAR